MNDPNNKVSIVITPTEKTDLLAHLAAVEAFFADKGPALTAAQRRMQSIAEERAGMLDVFPDEMTGHPQFCPSWVDMVEVNKDVVALRDVVELAAASKSACDRLNDFVKMIGNDLLLAFNGHFAGTREAAKRNQPGALASFQRMAIYYPSGGHAPTPPPPGP